MKPFGVPLISVSRNLNVGDWEVTSREASPGSPVPWSVRKTRLHGGKQEGVDLIAIDNGRMQITIIPARGMGVLSARSGDFKLGWDSPVREVVHPSFIHLDSRGGLGWLEGFNEHICRCGIEYNGHPGPDTFTDFSGRETTVNLNLHGRIANLPAQEVEIAVDPDPPYRIRIRGEVCERTFYGPRLLLKTEISTEPGQNGFRISDSITNMGSQPQEFEIFYHCNYGQPLLGEGARFVAPVRRVTPLNARAAEGIREFDAYAGPVAGFQEQVYCMRLAADARGRTEAMLRDAAADRAVSLAFSIQELPCLTLWKDTGAPEDGYVTGIEPGVNFPHNRRLERKAGRVPKLGGGERHSMTIDFQAHEGRTEVRSLEDRIRAIQGSEPPVLDERPEDLA
ncbi:MAG: aldose 1-epimerase family protein [Planctomycetes bacterium]|nr:aldose 1-epimerase family protein [Planctomycetota bacterium]